MPQLGFFFFFPAANERSDRRVCCWHFVRLSGGSDFAAQPKNLVRRRKNLFGVYALQAGHKVSSPWPRLWEHGGAEVRGQATSTGMTSGKQRAPAASAHHHECAEPSSSCVRRVHTGAARPVHIYIRRYKGYAFARAARVARRSVRAVCGFRARYARENSRERPRGTSNACYVAQ